MMRTLFVCSIILLTISQAADILPTVSPNYRYIITGVVSIDTSANNTWNPLIYTVAYPPTVLGATNRSLALSINSIKVTPSIRNRL